MSGTRHFRNPVQMNRLKDGNSENHLHNGGPAPNSNRNEQSEAATISPSKSHDEQHFEEQKNSKKKSDMTLEDMYNSNYEFEDDEDNDSDWEPSLPALLGRNVLERPKWFCLNCTMNNYGTYIQCDLCGEHRESGVVKHGFLAPPFLQAEGLTGNESDAIDRLKDLRLKSIAADNTTAIGFDERMLLHEEAEMKSRPHVERPDRLRAIAASLAASGIFPGRCYPISAREITHEELLMVHSQENIEAVELTSHMFSSYFTPDTYANQHSACAARLAAGLCSDLATAICSGTAKNGFALVRPPGHHAGVKQAMGFCLHNNAAIAASAAQRAGAKKVLIIDWDVHHGNGTQEIFEKNKSVLYISLHRYEGGKFYPGTGAADEVGTMGAEGYCVNVPWSRGGVGDNDYIFAFQQVVIPIASEFDPDFTIISAGFDAARGDPLGCCDVTPTGYEQMTQMCSALSGGKLLVILEGGYNLRSISSSATAVIKVLLGDMPEHDVEQVVPTKAGLRTVLDVLKIQIKYWPLMEPKFLKLQSEWGWYALQDKISAVDRNAVKESDEPGGPSRPAQIRKKTLVASSRRRASKNPRSRNTRSPSAKRKRPFSTFGEGERPTKKRVLVDEEFPPDPTYLIGREVAAEITDRIVQEEDLGYLKDCSMTTLSRMNEQALISSIVIGKAMTNRALHFRDLARKYYDEAAAARQTSNSQKVNEGAISSLAKKVEEKDKIIANLQRSLAETQSYIDVSYAKGHADGLIKGKAEGVHEYTQSDSFLETIKSGAAKAVSSAVSNFKKSDDGYNWVVNQAAGYLEVGFERCRLQFLANDVAKDIDLSFLDVEQSMPGEPPEPKIGDDGEDYTYNTFSPKDT